MHVYFFDESQFYNTTFLLGLLLKYAGTQKLICWACVWDSGLQRTHIQTLGESQSYNASFQIFSIRASAKI